MDSIPVWCGAASRCGLVLILMLGASGCKEQPRVAGKRVTLNCGDQTVTVDPKNGATPEAIYVCEGDIVTWQPTQDVQTFEVEFKKDYPFTGTKKKFDKRDPKSPGTKHQQNLKVYEYKITVNGQSFGDPQVIGGGGTP
jgi:hypothetical protein